MVGAAVESAGTAGVVVSAVLFFLDRAVFAFVEGPVETVVSVAAVAGVAVAAVFDFLLDLDLVLGPTVAVSVAPAVSDGVVLAVGVFFFFEVDFLVVVFLAVVVPVIVVDWALTQIVPKTKAASPITAIAKLVEIEPLLKNRTFILSPLRNVLEKISASGRLNSFGCAFDDTPKNIVVRNQDDPIRTRKYR